MPGLDGSAVSILCAGDPRHILGVASLLRRCKVQWLPVSSRDCTWPWMKVVLVNRRA